MSDPHPWADHLEALSKAALTPAPPPDMWPCDRCDRGSVTGPNGEHWRCAYCNGTGRIPLAEDTD